MAILNDLDYGIGSFEGFVIEDTNYVPWFLRSLARPTINDCPMSGGRVLGGITRIHQALKARLRLHVLGLTCIFHDIASR